MKNFLAELSFKDCKDNGLSVWQCPSFLFIIMGFVNVSSILGVYIVTQKYNAPELVVFSVSAVSILIFSVGMSIIHGFQAIAKTNKMKSEFVSIVSHQLKAPLSGMRWSTDILLGSRKENLDDSQIEYLKDIQENTSRMIRLVNDLLDVSRIDSGRMVMNSQEVDLNKMAESVVKSLNSFALAHNIQLLLKNKEVSHVKADQIRTRMVMQNFIDNAIKYVGNKKGVVKVLLEQEADEVIFSVEDNGVGIPQDQQQQVFEKFFRANNVAKRQTIGTGLGLYIAKVAIESSKGSIGFRSKEGKGSVFWFKLPIIRKK